ncbi:collagen alpha-1(XIV) chain-like [Dreissena polymorpha]|uniref:collagen alpha-1(XIV) chain-like n=1 Tax=Dreissena polymorpha TaxID=45954 RepID=UPI002263F95C|nr:collagen alpha-1(XIV) chain-like [Dreissena polymorpha]
MIVDRPSTLMTSDCCKCGFALADVIFVIDQSESISEDNFKKIKNFMKKLSGQMDHRGTTRIGSVSYNHFTFINFHLDAFTQANEILKAIDDIPYRRGSTNTAAGIKVAHDEMFIPSKGDRADAPDIMIVMTDGQSDDPVNTANQAKIAHNDNIRTVVIGIGEAVNITELQLISSNPAEDLFLAKNFDCSSRRYHRIYLYYHVPRSPDPTNEPVSVWRQSI